MFVYGSKIDKLKIELMDEWRTPLEEKTCYELCLTDDEGNYFHMMANEHKLIELQKQIEEFLINIKNNQNREVA